MFKKRIKRIGVQDLQQLIGVHHFDLTKKINSLQKKRFHVPKCFNKGYALKINRFL